MVRRGVAKDKVRQDKINVGRQVDRQAGWQKEKKVKDNAVDRQCCNRR